MKVGIDYREATKEFLAGKGQYVRNLVPGLLEDQDIDWVLFVEKGSKVPDEIESRSEIKYLPRGFLFHLFLWWHAELKLDLLFSPTSFIAPFFLVFTPFVVTVMDLVSWVSPRGHSKKAGNMERFFGPRTFRRACRILSISENTKTDLIEYFDIDPGKISVTHLAPALTPKPSGDVPVDTPFILYLGSLIPRKNIDKLLKAYSQASKDKDLPKLVLAGKNLWGDDLRKLAKRLGIENEVVFLGSVTEDVKKGLLEKAKIFVFISEYEGFGLPPLEAMSLGTPVIVSDRASLPEVVGDAGKLIDPEDIKAVTDSLIALNNESVNEKFSAQAKERAKSFSWKSAAEKTLSKIKQCLDVK